MHRFPNCHSFLKSISWYSQQYSGFMCTVNACYLYLRSFVEVNFVDNRRSENEARRRRFTGRHIGAWRIRWRHTRRMTRWCWWRRPRRQRWRSKFVWSRCWLTKGRRWRGRRRRRRYTRRLWHLLPTNNKHFWKRNLSWKKLSKGTSINDVTQFWIIFYPLPTLPVVLLFSSKAYILSSRNPWLPPLQAATSFMNVP